MTYATDTVSIQGSAPVELFEFVTPAATYRFTSYVFDVVYAANTYVATARLKRGTQEVTAVETAQEMEVEIPATSSFVRENLFNNIPRDIICRIRILEQVSGEARLIWEGPVTSASTTGRITRVLIPGLMDDAVDVDIPRVRFQTQCNHFLYDSRCRVNRATHDFAATVAVLNTGTLITISGVAGNPDQWFRAGEMVRDLDGERRLILDQTGTAIRISHPFREIAVGNAVTLYEGCDHSIETCWSKFFNRENFGGHPHLLSNFVKTSRLLVSHKKES